MGRPYLTLPLWSTLMTGNTPLFPAFPLYDMTTISSNLPLSAFHTGLMPTFASTHLIMSTSLVNLEGPVSPAPSLMVRECTQGA